jgi:GT2 family glycosyltransferase
MKARSKEPIDVEWVEGSFLMVSRRCIESVGPLDPYLFFYWEETDFCRRALHQNWRVVLAPRAIARHYAGGWSKGNDENKLTANRLQSRNYYIYKVVNPFSGFARNLIDAIHLLLVQIKQCIINEPSLAFFHLRVFTKVLSDLPTLYQKWLRDRKGGHPPDLQKGMVPMEPEIIRSKRTGHSTWGL